MLRDADVVLVMSPGQLRQLARETAEIPGGVRIVLGDLDPESIDRRTIIDPFDAPEEVFDVVYERIDRCCRALVEALSCAG